MKTLILVLIITSFIQSTILSLELVLIVLICRSFRSSNKANLFLAFGFGLLNSHLNLVPLGLNSILYLIIVAIAEVLSRSRFTGNLFLIIPLTTILLTVFHISSSFFLRESLQLFPNILIEGIISLPIFFLVRLWEERFTVRKDIRLKI